MALGTAEHKPNPRMAAPGAEHADAPTEIDKDQPIDPVHLLRLYGDKANSLEEMRAMALKAGAEALKAAAETVASQQEPVRPLPPRG